ncbi:MAG: hypothetical protein M1542_08555 [Thermotogae bacterium]|nr:hypothetical protein [Thermotogota bacterium]
MAKTIEFTTAPWKKPTAYEAQHLNSSCFLDPKERKYPIRKENNGPIYVHALSASAHYSAPSMWNDPDINEKAHKLLSLYHESEKLSIVKRSTRRKTKKAPTKKRRK